MNNATSTLSRYLTTVAAITLLFAPAIQQAAAAPGTLSQIPLYVGPQVEPNIVFVSDDSGSMDWGVMTPEPEGLFHINGLEYYYTHPAPGNLFHWVAASEEYLEQAHGLSPEESGVWRARIHQYNAAYYNPEVNYKPWIGQDKNGTPFGDSDPGAARVNPYDPDAGTVDLTNPNTSYSTDHPNVTGGFTVTNFYPARYYVLDDPGHNGPVEVTDAHTLIEITATPTAMTPSPPSVFPGGPNRNDCAAITECTYAEEIQNFANWFSYHRDRDLIAKNAATQALADITGARVGYATINNNDGVRTPVESMNLSHEEGNKLALFDRIYRTRPEGGTPLRNALDRTGRYFECLNDNIMGTGSSNCPILPAADGGTCQANYTVLMTDGFWNGPAPGVGNADGNNNTPYDGWPFADNVSNTLADVAMHYYERDLAPHLSNEVPTTSGQRPRASHQHMITHTVAFGVTGTLDPETDDPWDLSFSWPSPLNGEAEKIDDLWHAAFNGRGQFFDAQDPARLQSGLKSAFEESTRGRSSSASVAFNTSRLSTDSTLYQALFNPGDNWSGELIAIGLAADGTLASEIWNAAERLNLRNANTRTVLTWNEEARAGVPFRTLADLSSRQVADLDTGPSGAKDFLGQERLDFLRGDRSNEGNSGAGFRVRSGILGDIVYSNPVYVGRPEMNYIDEATGEEATGEDRYSTFRNTFQNRTAIVYLGANDGMLHGFRASDGEVMLSYAPNRLFTDEPGQGMHYLTDPSYNHRFYVDLSPTVSDARVGGSWRTILIGGYRAGGRGLFALDITNPDTLSEANADDIVMWEFTDDDDINLGHSFSKPVITQLENGEWAAVFGNGYNDRGDGRARLYILYLEDGLDGTWGVNDYHAISTGVGTTGNRNGLSTPLLVDSNGNGKADRAYAGDLHGNMWVFDLSGTNPGSATPQRLFSTPANQPITSRPVMARNTVATGNNIDPNILIYFGTGQYIVEGDKTSTATQSFYGIWDNGSNRNLTRANLQQQMITTDSTADLRVTTNHSVAYNAGGTDKRYGWYLDLPATGERVVVDPQIRGNFVFFNTLIPDFGECNSQGSGWVMALELQHGRTPEHPVFDINNDGEVDDGDLVNGTHAPSGFRLDGIPAGSTFLSDMMYTPDDSGNIHVNRIDDGRSADESGRLSWREVRQR